MRRALTTWLLCALVGPAHAAPKGDALPVDDAPPAETAAPRPSPAMPTDEPVSDPASPAIDGLWAWVERLEEEVLTDEALRAIDQHAEARFAEGKLIEDLGPPEVPIDVYDDPVAVVKVDPLHLDEIDPSEFDIPIVVNPEVKRWMRYFLGSGRKHLRRYLGRASTFVPMMHAALREKGLPLDLVYLSMMESGFNAKAYSRVGAAGLWQFMPATGRMYKLRVDWWVDDRRDPVKATHAAVEHLADLHKMHKGDWLLAWSSYNAGPGRTRGAIRKGNTRDFWKLARAGHLPSETANYAPKIMAAAIISKHPERYGFTDIEPQPAFDVRSIEVEGSVSVEVLAKCAGLTPERFKWYNPGLRRWATPAEGYVVNVPSDKADAFVAALAKVPAADRVQYVHHTVRRGETLSKIGARYGVHTRELVRINRLKSADRIVVGMSLVVPRPAQGAPSQLVTPTPAPVPTSAPPVARKDPLPTGRYTVKSGDALVRIARNHGVTVAQLKAWNQLDGDVIHPGQVLKLSGGSTAAGSSDRVVKYTVASGDTLIGIAARYSVSSADLQKWNGIDDPSHIRAGQVLEVRRPSWRQVEVKPGDSLLRIAAREGCTVEQLQAWNKLSGTVIHPGQVLKVRR